MDSSSSQTESVDDIVREDQNIWGKLISIFPKIENISLVEVSNTFGRELNNEFIFGNLKISSLHCIIKKNSDDSVLIEDYSENGTFIEDEKIGKNNTKIAFHGQIIYLLHPKVVKKQGAIGFILLIKPSEGLYLKPNKLRVAIDYIQKQTQEQNINDETLELMKCLICMDFIFKCVTTKPCQHNFCSSCYSKWIERSSTCPQCNEGVCEIEKDTQIDSFIECYLKINTKLMRTASEYEQMEKENTIKDKKTKVETKYADYSNITREDEPNITMEDDPISRDN